MFNNLTERLSGILKNLRGQGRLSEENIQDALKEVRRSLIEADVALPVIKAFLERLQAKAIGAEVIGNINPGQALIKIVYDELVTLMGKANEPLNLKTQAPVIILMAGLQGAGKTTTVGKLALYLKEQEQKKVLVTSCDIYRPAAIKQLETLASNLSIDYFPSTTQDKPVDIAKNALTYAQKHFMDVLIIDTAGRLAIDDLMMDEIKSLHSSLNPAETLFVVDSMTGQDAAKSAEAFHQALPLTGIILTKTDGDARGGAALSIREITGKPIKFIGVGEKSDALQAFHPERMASRILGMGDVLSLVEDAHKKIDKEKTKKLQKKIEKGGFDLADFKDQFKQMENMGGISKLISQIPGLSQQLPSGGALPPGMDEKSIKGMVALIDSMTPQERRFPQLVEKPSRKKRILKGSGRSPQELNRLLKQFDKMRKMMRQMSQKGGMQKMMRMMGQFAPGKIFK